MTTVEQYVVLPTDTSRDAGGENLKQNKMSILAMALCFVFCMLLVGPVAAKHYIHYAFVVAPSGEAIGVTDTASIAYLCFSF
jgi:hypothetical protein